LHIKISTLKYQEMFVKRMPTMSYILSGIHGRLNTICMIRNDSWLQCSSFHIKRLCDND